MHDPRFVGPVERLLYLRTLPAFDTLPPSELAWLATGARERFFRKGSRLLLEGHPAPSVYFVIEGKVQVRRAGMVLQNIEAPYTVGFLPVMSRVSGGVEAVAVTDALTLELPAEDLFDALEENFSLLEAGIRQMARQMAELQRVLEIAGVLDREEPVDTEYSEQELDLVQRMVLLRRRGPYQEASLDSLAELAKRATELRCAPGEPLWTEGDASDFGVHIVHGVVDCVGDAGARRFAMGPGSLLGHIESFANLPRSYSAVARTRVIGLRGDDNAFFDVLEDNVDLGLAFMGFQASILMDLYERRAKLGGAGVGTSSVGTS